MVKFIKSRSQPRSDERGLDFVLFRINEDSNVCGRQEVKRILIGNYVRKLNDRCLWLGPRRAVSGKRVRPPLVSVVR